MRINENAKGVVCMFQDAEQIKRRVSVNLSGMRKQELKAITDALGIGMSVLLGLLIRYFIHGVLNGTLTLDALLKEYQKLQRGRGGKKTCKITLRIKEEDFQKLNEVGNQWSYLPGELAGILAELLLVKIIDVNDIWNIREMQRTTLQDVPAESH
jgi:hypothetical protein